MNTSEYQKINAGRWARPAKGENMKRTTSNCTRCNCPVKNNLLTHSLGMAGPEIVFIRCTSLSAWRFDSSSSTIRFRIFPFGRWLRFDGDWYNTSLELAPSAWEAISSEWATGCSAYPIRKGSRECGGGESCLIFDIPPECEMCWRHFLRNLLSDPASWWYFDWSVLDFRPFVATPHRTPSGSQR